MVDLPPSDDPDDTQSFSVAAALRAPVGTALPGHAVELVRAAGMRLLAGLVLILLGSRLGGYGSSLGVFGGIVVVWGVLPIRPLAEMVGPSRSGNRAVLFAVANLLLLGLTAVPEDVLGDPGLWLDLAAVAQTTIALLGTAVVATVLARAHDGLGQLGRRDRWGSTRRFGLGLAVIWSVFGTIAAVVGEEPEGLLRLVVGFGSVLVVGVGILVLFLLGRSLSASVNVALRVGFGEG